MFPAEFLSNAKRILGDEFDQFIASLSAPASLSIRINPAKNSGQFEGEEKIPWSEYGRYLNERPSFTNDPLFHAGCYYVQDGSSQFLEQPFLQARKHLLGNLNVLDLCAAPGGKSTHLLSMIGKNDLLVSNEVIPGRNNILRQNILKWGNANVIVTQNDTSHFMRLDGFFDIVVVDAPCSGEGLFRKDKDAIGEWSVENVNRCSVRQNEILDHAYAALKPGGYLIYSTCTFEEEENEMQVERLVRKYEMSLVPIENNFQGIIKNENGLRFYPHRIKGEGFFISLLRKNNGVDFRLKKSEIRNDKNLQKYSDDYLIDSTNFSTLKKDDRVYAIPSMHISEFNLFSKELYVRLAGIHLGDLKGDDFIPSEGLALSNHMKRDLLKKELGREEALKFLKGEIFQIQSDRGWVLMNYKGFSLGWIKNLGNRVNNYYPKEWRIKKQN